MMGRSAAQARTNLTKDVVNAWRRLEENTRGKHNLRGLVLPEVTQSFIGVPRNIPSKEYV